MCNAHIDRHTHSADTYSTHMCINYHCQERKENSRLWQELKCICTHFHGIVVLSGMSGLVSISPPPPHGPCCIFKDFKTPIFPGLYLRNSWGLYEKLHQQKNTAREGRTTEYPEWDAGRSHPLQWWLETGHLRLLTQALKGICEEH